LAEAAAAAGQGDRTIRLPEEGPRELRTAAAAFNDMQARIARFDAERMRTLAAVGHDLRTPITSLRIRAEMLDDDDLREPMVRTLDEMTVMADGLVAYAKGSRDTEDTQRMDLAPFLRRLCEERGAAFVAGAEVAVVGRPVALGRAIGNLIENALRYGQSATVRLDRDEREAILLVEDKGPGIPPERLEAVFEPFVRGEDSRSQETGGAGLGLSIARNIVLAHGGAIRLENAAEGGLRVSVRLPLVSADRPRT
jgi:signal transduction histidine kinase